eukprot:TRINITY_DN12291_c0_g1_i1.p1 TRINITY_DN12291_c0_g1~~TRINITY_DN12291_c0_g1_i1.p1  ORF type:complete len:469 (-),score=105.06 TRINITY_DN12291_c0_g1_i1:178-1584(-)
MRIPGLTHAAPETVGLASEPLEQHREWARVHMSRHVYPGKIECVVKDNKIVYDDTIGYADAERKVPVTMHTLFRGFSMTKSVTAVAALILMDRGRLKVSDPVEKFIPSFKHLRVLRPEFAEAGVVACGDAQKTEPLKQKVTLGHLMMHTSGLGYGPMRSGPGVEKDVIARGATERAYKDLAARCDDGDITSLAHFVDELAKVPLRFQPGTQYMYGYGKDVLGRVIEVVSGKSLHDFFVHEIFRPLGFKDTTFTVPKSKALQVAAMYSVQRPETGSDSKRKMRRLVRVDGNHPHHSAWVRSSHNHKGTQHSGGGFWGSGKGGLLFSMHDLALFLNMLVNGGATSSGQQLLKRATANSLQKDWLTKSCVASRSSRRKLRGWDDDGAGWLGWSPIGHVQLKKSPHVGANFMGGTGHWWADRKRKMFCICLHEAFWDVDVCDWDEDRDDIDACVRESYKQGQAQQRKKRKLS